MNRVLIGDCRFKHPRKAPENALQTAFTTWRRSPYTLARYPALRWAYAVPNGGLRSKAVAGKLKAEGVEAGIFDYCIPAPRPPFAGLYLEFKTGRNQLSQAQRDFRAFAEAQGYRCVVVWTLDDAMRAVTDYLDGQIT